ncbi:nuclear transport factor 2 family protein [Marinicella sp. S1101]|uniref:nuclear transport factor 2 family protein n=1 Tax=Marinicella marina TaxID=2996016 RepID=UPI002260ED51|nr:nuclear transport factor 2 family protein [Marinicella marina]MCX7552655.1 nuclear transport factor 2 family protein [Marinicella marina]MDJ1139531.1 nuclear transport factor 2 family protein [Marinicella marina]
MNTLTNCLLLLACGLLSACHINLNMAKQTRPPENVAVDFVAAYNQQNIDAMLQLVDVDVQYMFIEQNQLYTETADKNALSNFLKGYFKQNPDAQSAVVSSQQSGNFIHQVERALWQDQNGVAKTQCSLSVYELNAGLIINVWYFTAYQCDQN